MKVDGILHIWEGANQMIWLNGLNKNKVAAYQEFNSHKIIKSIKKKNTNKKDIFGRGVDFNILKIDNSFPYRKHQIIFIPNNRR